MVEFRVPEFEKGKCVSWGDRKVVGLVGLDGDGWVSSGSSMELSVSRGDE